MSHARRLSALFHLALLWLSISSLQAQHKNDHLEPADSRYATVQQMVKNGAPEHPLAQVIVLPSFELTYVLSIEQEKQRYYLSYFEIKRASAPTSGNQPNSLPATEARKLAIKPELALALVDLWNTAIQQTRYPEPQMRIRTDGIRFLFAAFKPGAGTRAGTTWSPEAATRMSSLTGLVSELQLLATTAASATQQQQLTQDARSLLKELQPN